MAPEGSQALTGPPSTSLTCMRKARMERLAAGDRLCRENPRALLNHSDASYSARAPTIDARRPSGACPGQNALAAGKDRHLPG